MDKIFKFFPKAAQAAVSFQNPTFSPALDRLDHWHDHKHRPHASGPIMSLVPAEARSKSRNFDTQEPTSPKVSCMGQVKQKNKLCPRHRSSTKESKPEKSTKNKPAGPKTEKNSKNRPELKKQQSTLKKIFSSRRKSNALSNDEIKKSTTVPCNVPRLGQMRKYASSRDTLAGFDWTIAQVAPTDDHDRDYYSDGERVCVDDEDDDFEIPFSAPVLVTAAGTVLEPRKEINLWKRRTMAQPKPLQLCMRNEKWKYGD